MESNSGLYEFGPKGELNDVKLTSNSVSVLS